MRFALRHLLIAWSLGAAVAAAAEPAVVPIPASVEAREGEFLVTGATPIVAVAADADARGAAVVIGGFIARAWGPKLRMHSGAARDRAINFEIDRRGGLAPEAYRLEITPRRVTVSAATAAGLFYGGTTLWQLMRPQAEGRLAIGAAVIADEPRFAWAWRLEIRKYPRLASVGAWRVPAGSAPRADIDPATRKPRLYGGYYSQETVRSLVAYAADRAITIVPEIDMPGHASAAMVAYPRLGAAPAPPAAVPADWGIYPNAYSLEDSTFAFIEDVLAEVMALFPGRYIHIGGDEVETGQWKESPSGRALMARLGVDDAAKLQVHFTQRVARFLERNHRRPVGWDEILEPGLPPEAVVMSWRGIDGALKAAAKGYDTVLSPWPTLYFDNRQAGGNDEPPGRVRTISLEEVYRFDPMPAALDGEKARHVLGLQANVWTEHIRTEERVGWMTFPRAAAVAELGWSQPQRRDWDDFRRRIAAFAPRYAALGMPYAKSALAPPAAAPTGSRRMSRELKLCSENIALDLEDDAPVAGPRAIFEVDVQNPCWIYTGADLGRVRAVRAAVGQVPFNFQIGELRDKIALARPSTPEGELEVHVDSCDGPLLARLPLAPAAANDAVTVLPPAEIQPPPGKHDLCMRFAQRGLDPLWVIDWIDLEGALP